MVLKMLYNWDDMHIFSSALHVKPPAGSGRTLGFCRRSITHEQQMLIHEAASLDLHSLSVRFTFTHNAVGHQTSGACASKRPLPLCHPTGLEASMPT